MSVSFFVIFCQCVSCIDTLGPLRDGLSGPPNMLSPGGQSPLRIGLQGVPKCRILLILCVGVLCGVLGGETDRGPKPRKSGSLVTRSQKVAILVQGVVKKRPFLNRGSKSQKIGSLVTRTPKVAFLVQGAVKKRPFLKLLRNRVFSEFSGILWNSLEFSGMFWNVLECLIPSDSFQNYK